MWNIINCVLAGILVLLGACADGSITFRGFVVAVVASLIIAITKFRDYWLKEESEYTSRVFNFITI